MKRVLIFSILILTLAIQDGWALVPETMSYQGRLTDGAGMIVPDGLYSLTFNLYDDDIGGVLLWSESHSSVAVAKGIFSVILGSRNPLSLPFDQQYWLSVIVGGGGGLSSRIQLASSAYSLNARSVADGAVTATKIGAGQVVKSLNLLTDDVTLIGGNNVTIIKNSANRELTISSAFSLSDNSVMSNHIVNGAVDTNNIANGAVTATKIGAGQVVKSLNLLTDDVTLIGGNNVTIIKNSANRELTISSAFSLSGNSVLSNHIVDGTIAAQDVGFSYAGSTSPGGPATDLGNNVVRSNHILDGEVEANDLATGAVITGKIAAGAVTGAKILDGTVSRVKLKTATAEYSDSSNQYVQVAVTGGQYCFWPQVKMSNTNYLPWGVDVIHPHALTLSYGWTSYETKVSLYNGGTGGTIYAQFRYVTSSGHDLWIWLLIDKHTGEILTSSSTSDHPSYGNGGNSGKLPHPFLDYDETKHEIVLLDKETCSTIRQESETTGKSILTLINEEYKVDFTYIEEYEPLHSGMFLGEKPVMIETIPDYVKVRKLILLTEEENRQRSEERQQRELASQQAENEKKQRIAELKRSLGITDEQFDLLMQITK